MNLSVLRKIVAWCLFPLSIWYAVGVAVRHLCFRWGLKQQVSPSVFTIGVGNLSMGGTGKTPMVEYLIRMLAPEGGVALLSRGYKRKTKGFVRNDGSCNAELLGDEPAMIARKYPDVEVCVCESRVEGVRQMMEGGRPPKVVLLDDVYQHRYILPRVNILLTEYSSPYYRDAILPFGNLREFRGGRKRADIIVVTKCPASLSEEERTRIVDRLRPLPHQQVFFSTLQYAAPYLLSDNTYADESVLSSADRILVVSGIAHPQPMVEYLKSHAPVSQLQFPDHHDFSLQDLQTIETAYRGMDETNKIIVITEKDASRLAHSPLLNRIIKMPVYVLPIKVAFLHHGQCGFDAAIKKRFHNR